MELSDQVAGYIRAHDLLPAGRRLVLGVSGGPDSLAMLDLLDVLAPQLGLTLLVAHLDHGLRSQAASDAAFVRDQAQARGLPFHSATADTAAHARTQRQSIEEAARELRYQFLTRLALKEGAGAVSVAHTADDQAETVLMHFLRGSGLAGLRGMRPKTEVRNWRLDAGISDLPASSFLPPASSPLLIRPLLGVTRAQVEAYCARRGLQPRDDATNRDSRYFRNRLRHELLPALAEYNPNIRAVLARTAEVLAGDYQIVRRAVLEIWDAVAPGERQPPGGVVFDRDRWLNLGAAEQRALLREAITRLRHGLRDVDFAPVEAAVQFSRRALPGRSCDLVAGLRLSLTSDSLLVADWGAAELQVGNRWPQVDSDGNLVGWELLVASHQAGDLPAATVPGAPPGNGPEPAFAWFVDMDADRLAAPLRMRARQPGDRFAPLGLEGHTQKLADFMINVKLPEPLRARWPIVVCGDGVVWVAGLRLDERYRVTAETRRVLRLCLQPLPAAVSNDDSPP